MMTKDLSNPNKKRNQQKFNRIITKAPLRLAKYVCLKIYDSIQAISASIHIVDNAGLTTFTKAWLKAKYFSPHVFRKNAYLLNIQFFLSS